MGGDQLEQLINEYLSKNGGFIALIIVLASLCVIAIVAGLILSFVIKDKNPEPAFVENVSMDENKAKEKPEIIKEEPKEEQKYKIFSAKGGKVFRVKNSDGSKVLKEFDNQEDAVNFVKKLIDSGLEL